jgi:hypothetical protein
MKRILNMILTAFGVKTEHTTEIIIEPPNRLTPDIVERMIEAAGRDRVFAEAERLGWLIPDTPPLWVWAQIAAQICASDSARMQMTIEHSVH